LATLDVRGNINVGNNLINGVSMSDVLKKNASQLIQGLKTFAAMEIKNNISADSVNEVCVILNFFFNVDIFI
jgi:ABC-type branched-subunit amino acid transport system ATPase component